MLDMSLRHNSNKTHERINVKAGEFSFYGNIGGYLAAQYLKDICPVLSWITILRLSVVCDQELTHTLELRSGTGQLLCFVSHRLQTDAHHQH